MFGQQQLLLGLTLETFKAQLEILAQQVQLVLLEQQVQLVKRERLGQLVRKV
jgi:hypothetical protein